MLVHYCRSAVFLLFVNILSGCVNEESDPRGADIQTRLARLQQVEMEFDARSLSPQKRQLLKTLVQAGLLIHEAYLRQYFPEGVTIRDSLSLRNDEMSKNMLRLILRNGGPFDKMDRFGNFFNSEVKKPGAGFYPAGFTREEFESHLAMHPHKTEAFQSPYTILRRKKSAVIAVPYHEAYAQWIVPAADLLKKASALAENRSLEKYLASRADALISDDYYQSHVDWIDLDSDIDLLLAPDEVYDDALFGLKASYEVSVMVKDAVESEKLGVYTKHLDDLEQNLPMDEKYKRTVQGLLSPMHIVKDVFRGGDIATGYQAVAATLPNEPKVRLEKGTKMIFWKNVMDARVDHIILPIGRELIASDQIEYITPDGVFNDVLVHEICHSIGPVYVYGTNDSLPVSSALKEHYTTLEEAKADIAGLHSMKYFIDKGILPKAMERVVYVSMLASIFRTIRFGTTEAHGKAAICELNYLIQNGAVRINPVTKKWSVVFEKISPVITDLAHELLTLQARGDYEGTRAFFESWSRMSKDVEASLARLEHLPVDIEPVYSVRWD